MADDNQGECKTCGENAGSKPAAKSMVEVARESWLQDVTVRPYQPTVEALAAASRGEGSTLRETSSARPAPRDLPTEPWNPAPRVQPHVEVSYLSAPWQQAAFQPPQFESAQPRTRATQPQSPLGAIKTDPRANADVEYLSWFPGDGSPWVEQTELQQAPAESVCECQGVSIVRLRGGNEIEQDPGKAETASISADVRTPDDVFRLTVSLQGNGAWVYEVRLYNDSRPSADSLEFVFSQEQQARVEQVSERDTLTNVRESAAKERLKSAKIYQYRKRVARGIIGIAACDAPFRFELKLDRSGRFPPQNGDKLRVQVYANGALCGERTIAVSGPGQQVSGVDASDIEDDEARKALAAALVRLSLVAYDTDDCPKCRAIQIEGGTDVDSTEWRQALFVFRDRVRGLIEEGAVRSDRNGRYEITWPEGEGDKAIKRWKKSDGRLRAVIGMRPNPDDNRPVTVSVTSSDACPIPQVALAVGNNGRDGDVTVNRGADATAVAPWTGFAAALAGDGHSMWDLEKSDRTALHKVGHGPTGDKVRGLAMPPKLGLTGVGGVGGNASATAGSCLALGGTGGNGATGGAGGTADVADGSAPNCCAGAGAGVAIGGHGGNGCRGNGGSGGNASASSSKTDCPTRKLAFGGNGGFGVGGEGGNGGNVVITNGDKSTANNPRSIAGAGGNGGYGSNAGGSGGGIQWKEPEAAGRTARGNGGSGGNSERQPGGAGQRTPSLPDRDPMRSPPAEDGERDNLLIPQKYEC